MGVCPGRGLAERNVTGRCSADEMRAIEYHLTEYKGCRRRKESTRPDMLAGSLFERRA
jgi:hypothetical protein